MRQAWTSQGKIRAKEKENRQKFSEKFLDMRFRLRYNVLIKNEVGN